MDYTSDAISVMKDGASNLCDHAEGQWLSDKYGLGEEVRQENLKKWKLIRARVSELISYLKDETKG